jgi:hypothetical protein
MLSDQGFNPTDEGTRLRLRAAIQGIVGAVWMLKAGTRYRPSYLVQIDFRNGERRFVWWGEGVGEEASVLANKEMAKGPGLETFRQNPHVFGFAGG